MDRTAYRLGYFEKSASEGAFGVLGSAMDKGTTMMLLLPLIAGALPAAAMSIATSPTKRDFSNLQDEIYNRELESLLEVMKRRRAMAAKERHESEHREIHI
jgi:hypothetical protein